MRLQNNRSYSDAILKTRNLLSLKRRRNQVDDNGSAKCVFSKRSNHSAQCNYPFQQSKKPHKYVPLTFCRTLEICTLPENILENLPTLKCVRGCQKMKFQKNRILLKSGFNHLGKQTENQKSKPCIFSKKCIHCNRCIHSNFSFRTAIPAEAEVTVSERLEIATFVDSTTSCDVSASQKDVCSTELSRGEVGDAASELSSSRAYLPDGIAGFRKTPLLFLCLSMIFLFSSCGIYSGGFQRGGDLTSNFLERIHENPQDEEDILLPSKEETER